MKVLLLFPPEWLPTEPYLSLPMLTAVLRSAGHEVIQKDINVLMYDMMLSASYLRHIQKRITHARAHYQQRNTGQSLNQEYQPLLNNLEISCFNILPGGILCFITYAPVTNSKEFSFIKY